MSKSKKEMLDYLKWIRLLAGKILSEHNEQLSAKEKKTLWMLIKLIQGLKPVYENGSMLKNAIMIIDKYSTVKSTDLPIPQYEYTKKERMVINKGIRLLHGALDHDSKAWLFCQRYLFSKNGIRRKKMPSNNRLYHAAMTIAINPIA